MIVQKVDQIARALLALKTLIAKKGSLKRISKKERMQI